MLNTPAQDIQSTLNERKNTHGDFTKNSEVMQTFKYIARFHVGWNFLDDTKKEALEMIFHKIGRILCGNPNHSDHWHDIAGYATLVENIILTGSSHQSTQPTTSLQSITK